jgi:hypothetical protein
MSYFISKVRGSRKERFVYLYLWLHQATADVPASDSQYAFRCGDMARTWGRFIRFLRSILVPSITLIGFSCLLTFFFVLYQPTRGPGDTQRLGWQSWDTVSPLPPADWPDDINKVDQEMGSLPPSTPGDHDPDVDWWNVTSLGPNPVDSASLPLDVWAPLLPHDTGCMLPLLIAGKIRTKLHVDSVRDRCREVHV